jgi:hypothetical protein
VFILSSCSNNKSKTQSRNIVIEDSPLPKEVADASIFNDLLTLKRVVNLETLPQSLIGEIESIYYIPSENKIIILDSKVAKSIFVFNLEGKFMYKIGRHGIGPGEFLAPNNIAVDNNRVIVFDSARLTLLFYNLSGKFINEISFPSNNWNFYVDRMYLWKNDLYIYDNNEYRNVAPDGKDYRVFVIKDCKHFDSAYGKHENTLDFDGGDITSFNNRIVYSDIFAGNIYQILSGENQPVILASMGVLTNINDYNNLGALLKNIRNVDVVTSMATIRGFLFVKHNFNITIINNSGKILKDLQYKFILPKGYSGLASRLGFIFYNNGIIVASNDERKISESEVPNPSLIFYEIKDNK